MNLGQLDIYPISSGTFKLDGGAMFGIVPKTLWEKKASADRFNRIQMASWCLLIQAQGKNILVNTGLGDKYKEKYRRIYSIDYPTTLLKALSKHGLTQNDIHLVINTHLHFDHCGGNTVYDSQNKPVPAFPKARYIIQKEEWAKATQPDERSRASYLQENILPLQSAGIVDLIEGDQEIITGVKVKLTGGHTKGHQVVLFESAGQKGIYWSDLIPTTAHVSLPYIMAYDFFPEETLPIKKQLIEQALKEHWLCFWEHDPKINCGYLERSGNEVKVTTVS